jgi:hypothetical protein
VCVCVCVCVCVVFLLPVTYIHPYTHKHPHLLTHSPPAQILVTRSVSPPFGKLQAVKLALEQKLRSAFSNLTTHSEVRCL